MQRVTDIMAEISASTSEQSTSIAEVGQAVSQLDQMTQQNAALVEEVPLRPKASRTSLCA